MNTGILRLTRIHRATSRLGLAPPLTNHSLTLTAAHPAHRLATMAPDGRTTISTLARAGLSPGQILNTLHCLEPEVPLIPKDISNLIQKARLEELDGRTPIQWLEVETN
jgi:hypothetical protein